MAETLDRTASIFAAAVAVATAQERAAYLDQACAGNADLRGHVEALLRAHERAGRLLDRPVPGGLQQTQLYGPGEQSGTVIAGRYKLLEAIGEGGMGTVWMTEQTQPVRRKVALKLIKAGMDSKSVLARFEAERQALAVMDHPNIAKVLDGGLTETGRPFFVMEYVKGVPITEYCDATRLSIPERLNLFVQVCRAVQHAHQKGIIHRDLKPSNILVAPYDDKPVPKVIDFGLAKAMHQSLTERTLHTAHETVLGTPLYMSPEQAQLNNLDVDTRSDIYSLGVLLYELLTGTTPLEKQRFKEAAWDEIRRIIREEEPPRPSTRLSSSQTLPALAAGRQTEPAKLTKLVCGELDWIVMKALEKDRARRYDTANGLAQDIECYLKDEPVQAGPPSPTYRLRKFVKRNQRPVLGAVVVLLTLLAGIAGTTWGLVEAQGQRRAAVEQRDHAEREKSEADKQRESALAARNEADRERRLAEEARNQKTILLSQAEGLVYDLQFREAYRHFQSHDLVGCRLALDDCRRELRGPEYGYLVNQLEQKVRTLRGYTGYLVLSGDGKRVFSLSQDGTIKVWDVEADKELRILRGHKEYFDLVVSGDGKRLFLGCMDDTIKVWDVDQGKEVRTLPGHRSPMALSGNGKRLFSQGLDSTIKVWDVDQGKEVLSLPGPWGVGILAVTGDGKRLFSAGNVDGTIKVWDVEADKELRILRGHGLEVLSLALSGDGKRLFSGSGDHTIKVWDVETGKEILTLRGHNNAVRSLAPSHDGKRLFSGGDNTIKMWDVETGKEILTLRGQAGVASLALSANGKWLVSASNETKVWNLETVNEARTLPGPLGHVVSLALSGDGKRLFLGEDYDVKLTGDGRRQSFSPDSAIKEWDLETGNVIDSLRGHADAHPITSLALTGDSKRLFSGSSDNTIKMWDLETGKDILTLRGHTQSVLSLVPSGDGERLVSSSGDGTIKMWDLNTGLENRTLTGQPAGGHEGQLLPLALSADGKWLFSGGQDNKILVWDLDTGLDNRTLIGHTGSILSLALSGDGKRLYSGSVDRTIRVWDVETGKEFSTLLGNGGDVGSVALSGDGKRLFSGGGFFFGDTTIKLWDLATGQELLSLPGHQGGVASLALSGDDKRLVSVGRDGTVKIWNLDAGRRDCN